MPPIDNRYAGSLGQDYESLKLAIPTHDQLQDKVKETVAGFSSTSGEPLKVLEIGCGDGFTSRRILTARSDLHLTAFDNSERMVTLAKEKLADWPAGRLEIIQADALEYLSREENGKYDIAASALTLHNFQNTYRHALHREIFRVLKPGGLFVNGDKYVGDDSERFLGLQNMVKRFFDIYLPLGKVELLEDLVLHNIADQAPERVMREKEAVSDLQQTGFDPVHILCRFEMQAVVACFKPVRT